MNPGDKTRQYGMLDIILAFTKCSSFIVNILMQGTLSQKFHLVLSFNFLTKKGNICEFWLFVSNLHFLYVIK